MYRTRLVVGGLVAALAGLGLATCGGDTGGAGNDETDDGGMGDCPVGTLGCACTAGGACDPGLDCRSEICVDAGGGDGGSDATTTASGDGSSATATSSASAGGSSATATSSGGGSSTTATGSASGGSSSASSSPGVGTSSSPSSSDGGVECGNGVLEGSEQCDCGGGGASCSPTQLGGVECLDQGYLGGGDLSCTVDCLLDETGCVGPECGVAGAAPGGACPAQCTGCSGNVCAIDCTGDINTDPCADMTIDCPDGWVCEITCDDACNRSTFHCSQDDICSLNCTGLYACEGTQLECGIQQCRAMCDLFTNPSVDCGSSRDCVPC